MRSSAVISGMAGSSRASTCRCRTLPRQQGEGQEAQGVYGAGSRGVAEAEGGHQELAQDLAQEGRLRPAPALRVEVYVATVTSPAGDPRRPWASTIDRRRYVGDATRRRAQWARGASLGVGCGDSARASLHSLLRSTPDLSGSGPLIEHACGPPLCESMQACRQRHSRLHWAMFGWAVSCRALAKWRSGIDACADRQLIGWELCCVWRALAPRMLGDTSGGAVNSTTALGRYLRLGPLSRRRPWYRTCITHILDSGSVSE